VWRSTIDGQKLRFRLTGINNQNFIMRDEETGTWWQQASGEAITGPLRGSHLESVFHDEVAFEIWKLENPNGRVLRPDEKVLASGEYAPADWEKEMSDVPVVTPAIDPRLEPRTLVIGVALNSESKAYPLEAVREQGPVIDTLGGVPILLLVARDGRSVRAFERNVDGKALDFYALPDTSALRIIDADTGSEWNFRGKAISGPLQGRELRRVPAFPEYWFDWNTYHPDTQVFE
jgi:hypothetical protein